MFAKKALLLFVIMIIAPIVFLPAQSKETLAVLDFTTEAVSETEMTAIVEFLSAELFKTKKYTVIDVSQRQAILSEMEFSMSGCSDDTCALEIGKMLSAELIVVGNLSKVGSRYLMSVKMLETETSRTMGTANGKFNNLDELIDGLEPIALGLSGEEAAVQAVEKPVPNSEPEPEPASRPEIKPIPTIADTKPDIAEAAPKEEPTAPPSAEKPESAKEPGSLLNKILITGGALLQAGGNFANSAAYPLLLESDIIYKQYLASTTNPGELFESDSSSGTYYDYYDSYSLLSYASLGLSGAGGLVLGAQPFLGGGNSMSTLSKIIYSAGITALAAGNIFGQLAVSGYTLAGDYYDDYMTAAEGLDNLWTQYENTYNEQYSIPRFISYGLWGSGAAMMATAAFLPGEGMASNGILNKILYAVGSLMMSGGNVTAMMAQSTLLESRRAYGDYASSTENLDSLYQIYDETYGSYEMLTFTSYGLWLGGAVLSAASLFIPGSSGTQVVELPFDLEIHPAPVGFGAVINIQMR